MLPRYLWFFVPILECLGLGWLEIFAVVWPARFWLLVELCPRFDQLAVSHAVVLGSLAAGVVLECGLAFFCVFGWFFKCSGVMSHSGVASFGESHSLSLAQT